MGDSIPNALQWYRVYFFVDTHVLRDGIYIRDVLGDAKRSLDTVQAVEDSLLVRCRRRSSDQKFTLCLIDEFMNGRSLDSWLIDNERGIALRGVIIVENLGNKHTLARGLNTHAACVCLHRRHGGAPETSHFICGRSINRRSLRNPMQCTSSGAYLQSPTIDWSRTISTFPICTVENGGTHHMPW
jgi:hypothetical protein